jgi:hypothetical protein
MADRLSTTSSKTGTLPPTSPVLPPWGTTARRRSLQCFSTADTCCVDLGLSATLLLPLYLPIQSLRRQRGPKGSMWAGLNSNFQPLRAQCESLPVIRLQVMLVSDQSARSQDVLERTDIRV